MKSFLIVSLFCLSAISVSAQTKAPIDSSVQIVEASCGQCKFKLKGKGCNLAVRINGQAFFVDGSDIDSHGDAHAKEGFCNAIRQAAVKGEIVNNRFKATYFQLMPVKKD
jgi:hypothetical protein